MRRGFRWEHMQRKNVMREHILNLTNLEGIFMQELERLEGYTEAVPAVKADKKMNDTEE